MMDYETVINVEVPKIKKCARDVVSSARGAFNIGRTKPIEFRRAQLKNLLRMVEENSSAMEEALWKDLARPRQEASSFDIEISKNGILTMLMNLDAWSKPEKPPKPLANTLDKIRVYKDPYGVVLIMSSWNFPINLVIIPLAGAIAAGNSAVVKPSEVSPASAELLANLLPKYLDKDCYQIFLGGIPETTDLLQQRFDYIFFTGSSVVGKIVHAAANKYLTPVTLELGGKSPTYIDKTVDMDMTVRRIFWGKFSNAGQVCISPDYILCSKEVQEEFITTAMKVLNEWYGEDAKTSPNYGRIINERHFTRLISFIKDKRNVAVGGQSDATQKYIEPTLLTNVNPNDPIMQEEIFGPILPFITVENPYDAVRFINAREKPLVIYVFSKQSKIHDLFIDNTSSGGVMINDTLLHFSVEALPFGGVGFSGMGAYHGKDSFDTFTHKKSLFQRDFSLAVEKMSSLRYPPYSDMKTDLVTLAMKPRRGISRACLGYMGLFILGAAFIVLVQLVYYYVTNKSLMW